MNEWHDLFVATSGSAAALTGLIFVAVSINLDRILSFSRLVDRALLSLVLLLNILIVSILFLVPGQEQVSMGSEITALSVITWIIITRIDTVIYRGTSKNYKTQYRIHLLLNQLAILPYLIAGIMLFTNIEAGTYWIVPGICSCFVKAIWDAWILLVEINR